jgi:glycosyltransferase involved in cell wall biosynthesis
MRVTFIDDSIPFDGYSPPSQPLDGAEKLFASLPPALSMRGHEVTVINRAAFPVTVHGSRWITWDGERPVASDALIAFRRPELLDQVPVAGRRIVWAGGPLADLQTQAARDALERHRPRLVFITKAQQEAFANPLGLETSVNDPGIASAYLEDDAMNPAEPPHAITTAHPLGGLLWLLRLWMARIRPEAPTAELHVYSAVLDKAQLGGAVPPGFASIIEEATAARAYGVVVKRPLADPAMAEAYRQARAHLHPGEPGDVYGFTLAESQAMGLPAVARAANPTVVERVADAQTGTIAANNTAFAGAAISLLTDRLTFDRMSANARLFKRGRTWAIAAAEWEDKLT